jgi:hypothetical protein
MNRRRIGKMPVPPTKPFIERESRFSAMDNGAQVY